LQANRIVRGYEENSDSFVKKGKESIRVCVGGWLRLAYRLQAKASVVSICFLQDLNLVSTQKKAGVSNSIWQNIALCVNGQGRPKKTTENGQRSWYGVHFLTLHFFDFSMDGQPIS
jgi:hypothetical protein